MTRVPRLLCANQETDWHSSKGGVLRTFGRSLHSGQGRPNDGLRYTLAPQGSSKAGPRAAPKGVVKGEDDRSEIRVRRMDVWDDFDVRSCRLQFVFA